MSKEPTTNSQGLSEECHAMISRISHEVRNPVAVIHSFHQLLLLAHPELSNDLYFQKIQENMAFLNSLLDELSCYNHSYRAVRAYVNPYLLLQNLCADTGVLLEKQQVSIELVKESAIPRFALDTTQFRQLFLNLIRNAAEAMPSGGTIKISLCFDGDFLTIRVQDTGCGIPAEDLPTLFDLFVTHKKNGTGLGLAICKEIVTAHDGTISVSSVPGEGSTFTVVYITQLVQGNIPDHFIRPVGKNLDFLFTISIHYLSCFNFMYYLINNRQMGLFRHISGKTIRKDQKPSPNSNIKRKLSVEPKQEYFVVILLINVSQIPPP